MMAAVPAEASTFAIPTAFQRLSSGAELVTLRPRVLWQRSPGRVLWNAKALKLPEIKKNVQSAVYSDCIFVYEGRGASGLHSRPTKGLCQYTC